MTKKGEPLFTLNLGENGGQFHVRTLDEFVAWTEHEKEKWRWLETAIGDRVPHSIASFVHNQLDSIINYARSIRDNNNLDQYDPNAALAGHYGGVAPQLYHSTSSIGRTIFAIRDVFGGLFAADTYALLTNQLGLNLQNPYHFRLMSLVSNPALIDGAKYMQTVEGVFSDFAKKSRSIHAEQQDLLTASKRASTRLTNDARNVARRTLRRAVWMGWNAQVHVRDRGERAVKMIDDTRAAYEQQMQLQAAVSYWNEKRQSHKDAKRTAFEQLMWYTGAATIVGLVAFYIAIVFMLEASNINVWDWMVLTPSGTNSLAPSAFVVVTAAAGTIVTCLFWAARILVRNFLNERRLEADSEERRIMTQTYLALVKQGAAGEEDRLVILNALFRPSGDGVKSDEGGSEIALPAIIAKLMDQRMPK